MNEKDSSRLQGRSKICAGKYHARLNWLFLVSIPIARVMPASIGGKRSKNQDCETIRLVERFRDALEGF
jgi:hypothetical protein